MGKKKDSSPRMVEYTKYVCDRILVDPADLSTIERQIIEYTYDLFQSKLEDMKVMEDEIKRLSIDNLNLKDLVSEMRKETKKDSKNGL